MAGLAGSSRGKKNNKKKKRNKKKSKAAGSGHVFHQDVRGLLRDANIQLGDCQACGDRFSACSDADRLNCLVDLFVLYVVFCACLLSIIASDPNQPNLCKVVNAAKREKRS